MPKMINKIVAFPTTSIRHRLSSMRCCLMLIVFPFNRKQHAGRETVLQSQLGVYQSISSRRIYIFLKGCTMKLLKYLLLILPVYCVNADTQKPDSIDELKKLYLEYQRSGNVDGILSLTYREGEPEFIAKFTKRNTAAQIKHKIVSAEIIEISEETLAQLVDGVPYKDRILIANLTPLKSLKINYDNESGLTSTTMHIGQKNGVYYFVTSKFK